MFGARNVMSETYLVGLNLLHNTVNKNFLLNTITFHLGIQCFAVDV